MVIKINYTSSDVYVSTSVSPVYVVVNYSAVNNGGGAVWGGITGTLSDQTDLQDALDDKVPYTGAIANVDLGEYELKAGQLTLDVSPTGTAAVGTTRWNNTIGSSETTLKGGSVILKNGVDLVARIVNKVTPNTTLTKAAYQAVRVSGAQGQRLAVAFAQANNDANSADTIGLVTETIPTNQEGFIITVGQIENINTTGSLQGETWADGDVLYLSPTTPGAITKVKPTGAGHIVVIGYVEYAHANNGKIYVKVMNGWELDELHDVSITSVANNEALIYESSSQLWKNKTIATALGFTPVPTTRTLTINGTSLDLSSDRSWTIAAGITGSGATGQVAYWNGTSSQTGSAGLVYNDSTGLMTLSKNQNAVTELLVSNTTSGTASASNIRLTSDASAGNGGISKNSTNITPYKIVASKDLSIYNTSTGGDIAILNDFATGNIKFAAGASSTAQMTLHSNGNLTARSTLPSTLGASSFNFFLGLSGLIGASATINDISINNNAYFNGTNVIYKNNGTASNLYFDSSGNIGFSTAPSGTAGGIVTFTERFRLFNTGNLLLQNGGTFTDGGQRLQVIGDAFIRGSGSIALEIQNSSGVSLAQFRGDTRLTLGGKIDIGLTNTAFNAYSNSLNILGIIPSASWATEGTGVWVFDRAASSTSGTLRQIRFGGIGSGFAPSSGTATHTHLEINSTINQTGGANGITRGLYVNPTLTAAADWRSIEWSNNSGWGLYGAGTAPNFLGGNLTVSRNQNGGTIITVSNTTSGNNSQSGLVITSDSLSGNGYFAKYSSAKTAYKIVNASDFYLINDTAGDISILNDWSSGKIKFSGGAASTAQMTLTAAGRLLLGTTTEGTQILQVNGDAYIKGTGTTSATNALLVQNSAGNTTFQVLNAGGILVHDPSFNQALQINGIAGSQAMAIGSIGSYANASGSGATAIGRTANASGAQSVSLGIQSTASGLTGIAIGYLSVANSSYGIALGFQASSGFGTYSIAFNAQANASNQFVAGQITDVYFGSGVRTYNTNGLSYTIHGSGGGTNTSTAGGDITIAGGKGIGTQEPGRVYFATPIKNATNVLQTLVNRFAIIQDTGNVVIQNGGTFTDELSSRLTVNSTTQGFLTPRMTNAQRLAISSPAIGLEVYCTDMVEGKYIYKSTGWTFII
jgi:nitrogen fixation protein